MQGIRLVSVALHSEESGTLGRLSGFVHHLAPSCNLMVRFVCVTRLQDDLSAEGILGVQYKESHAGTLMAVTGFVYNRKQHRAACRVKISLTMCQ